MSPLGLPLSLHANEVREPHGWVGRTSTEDQQDPRQSLIQQLERSKSALPESWVIVHHFYDVESGRMELDMHGSGSSRRTLRVGGILGKLGVLSGRRRPLLAHARSSFS